MRTVEASVRGRCPECNRALPRHAPGCWVPGSGVEIGNCYELALFALSQSPEGFLLVHGEPTLSIAPFVRFGHAWLEREELVVDVSIPNQVRRVVREAYYRCGQIDPQACKRYDLPEAVRLAHKYQTFGPWE